MIWRRSVLLCSCRRCHHRVYHSVVNAVVVELSLFLRVAVVVVVVVFAAVVCQVEFVLVVNNIVVVVVPVVVVVVFDFY